MRITGLALSLLLLSIPVAAQQKSEASTQSKAPKEKSENKKSGKISDDNEVAKFGKDTGELASKGAVETSKAATRGAKWLVKPWSKNQPEKPAAEKPAKAKASSK